MSIWILGNTVGEAAAQLIATDASNTETADQTKVGAIRGGPAHLKYTSEHATEARRFVYVNKTNGLAADFCVIADAAAHVGKTQNIIRWASYTASPTTLDSRTIASGDLVGVNSQAMVFPFSAAVSGQEALGVEYATTDYRKTSRQIYFSSGIELAELSNIEPITLQRVSIHEPPIEFMGKYYHLWGRASLLFSSVTRAKIESIETLPEYDPVFLYDDSTGATGIRDRLWRCIIEDLEVQPDLDDDLDMRMQVAIIREWEAR